MTPVFLARDMLILVFVCKRSGDSSIPSKKRVDSSLCSQSSADTSSEPVKWEPISYSSLRSKRSADSSLPSLTSGDSRRRSKRRADSSLPRHRIHTSVIAPAQR